MPSWCSASSTSSRRSTPRHRASSACSVWLGLLNYAHSKSPLRSFGKPLLPLLTPYCCNSHETAHKTHSEAIQLGRTHLQPCSAVTPMMALQSESRIVLVGPWIAVASCIVRYRRGRPRRPGLLCVIYLRGSGILPARGCISFLALYELH